MWNGFKDSGRNSRFFEGKAYRPPQERGFHRFFFHGGENPQIPQNPGSFEGGRETQKGFFHKKPTGESETPCSEKTERRGGGISRDLVAIDTSGVVPFLRRVYREFPPKTLSCGGPLPPSICKPRNLPRVFLEELRKVPPFPLKPRGTGGSERYGEFEGPRRNTVSSSSSFLQDLPYPWNGGTAQSDLPGGFFGPPRRRWILTP